MRLTEMGIDSGAPIVVYGSGRDGWEGEGRIAWMLRDLAAEDVAILDGGFKAWVDPGLGVTRETYTPREGAARKLLELGLKPDRPVITYCTGGVRSAEAFWMLRAIGFKDVKNHGGSFWERAADRTRPVAGGAR